MIREGKVEHIEAFEKVLCGLEHELLHDGSKSKEKLFSDQTDSKVYYKLYEVYAEPTGMEIAKLLTVDCGVVRLVFDYRDKSGMVEMTDRDYANLWAIQEFRKGIEAIRKY